MKAVGNLYTRKEQQIQKTGSRLKLISANLFLISKNSKATATQINTNPSIGLFSIKELMA